MNVMDDNINKNKDKYDQELLYVVRKFTILTGIALLSYWLNWMLITLAIGSAIGGSNFDSIFNLWCIVLFDMRYDNIYIKFCKCIAKPELKINSTTIKIARSGSNSSVEINTNTNTSGINQSYP